MTREELASWLQHCDLDEVFITCNFLHNTGSKFEGYDTCFYYQKHFTLTKPFDLDELKKKEDDILSDFSNKRTDWGVLIQTGKRHKQIILYAKDLPQ